MLSGKPVTAVFDVRTESFAKLDYFVSGELWI